jgi:hypothetical protein
VPQAFIATVVVCKCTKESIDENRVLSGDVAPDGRFKYRYVTK